MKMFLAAVVLSLLAMPVAVQAEDLDRIPADMAQNIGAQLVEKAAELDKLQVKIEPDSQKANGVHVPKKIGALIVPQKDLTESEELAAKFKVEAGAPLALLFLYHIVPVIDGKALDANKLRSITITDGEGVSHDVQVIPLAVRQLADDDYRLYGYGTDAKPVLDVKFAEGTGPGDEPVAVEIKDVNHSTRQGTVAITVFGKYQATFKAAHDE
jgi:hypothetical protein